MHWLLKMKHWAQAWDYPHKGPGLKHVEKRLNTHLLFHCTRQKHCPLKGLLRITMFIQLGEHSANDCLLNVFESVTKCFCHGNQILWNQRAPLIRVSKVLGYPQIRRKGNLTFSSSGQQSLPAAHWVTIELCETLYQTGGGARIESEPMERLFWIWCCPYTDIETNIVLLVFQLFNCSTIVTLNICNCRPTTSRAGYTNGSSPSS